jgi:hypothetical protein
MNNTPQGGAIEGNASDDALTVIREILDSIFFLKYFP